MPELNSTPVFGDRRMRQQSLWLQEHWSTIRMPAAITTGIITTAIADTITAQITTAMEINIWILCLIFF
jgi:hypothetical protein